MKQPKHKGFTLVETLVSLFILSLTLTGVFALLSSNLRIATTIKNNFIASTLVQEGMEIVRNLRDEDWIVGREFGSFGSTSRLPDGDYRVQWNSALPVPGSLTRPLSLNAQGFYQYDVDATNVETPFYRTISIRRITDEEIQVIVRVFWQGRNGEMSVSAEEHLFNWYQ